jgi:hypothetical protein
MEEVERLRVREKKLQEAIEIWKKKHEQQQKVIEAMATWISKQDIDELICKDTTDGACGDENGRPCIECIINHFKEVKE